MCSECPTWEFLFDSVSMSDRGECGRDWDRAWVLPAEGEGGRDPDLDDDDLWAWEEVWAWWVFVLPSATPPTPPVGVTNSSSSSLSVSLTPSPNSSLKNCVSVHTLGRLIALGHSLGGKYSYNTPVKLYWIIYHGVTLEHRTTSLCVWNHFKPFSFCIFWPLNVLFFFPFSIRTNLQYGSAHLCPWHCINIFIYTIQSDIWEIIYW